MIGTLVAKSREVSKPRDIDTLETKSRHDANFVVAGGTDGCHNDPGATSDNEVGIMAVLGYFRVVFQILQPLLQCWCWDACQVSKRCENANIQSCGSEISRDLIDKGIFADLLIGPDMSLLYLMSLPYVSLKDNGQKVSSLQWRQNEHDGVWNHQPHNCLLNL